MAQGPFLRQYAVETTIPFTLFEVDGVDFRVDAAAATADTTVSIDEATATSVGNLFSDDGMGYSLVLTAGTMTGARIVVYLVDSATKVWLDDSLVIETYGNASAMHAFDLNESHASAATDYGVTTAATVLTQIGGFVASAITAAAVATGVLTADKIAGDAITAAKIADDAISAEHLNTGAITADAFAADALTAGTLATGVLTADAFAADALVAATIATGAITADAFAANALTAGTFAADSVATAAKLLAYVQLMTRKDDAIETDNAAELTEINADGGNGAGTFSSETDSGEAIRDRGDRAWLTGSSEGATDVHTTTDWVRTVGDNDGGTGSATVSVNGTYFATGETASGTYLEVLATFTLGANDVGVALDFWGFYDGSGAHYIDVEAWDNTTSQWEIIGQLADEGAVDKHAFSLSPNHTNAGTVLIRFLHGGGGGNANHVFNVDKAQITASLPSTDADTLLAYIQLLARSDAAIETDRSTELAAINTNEGTGAGNFSAQTDSVEALRDNTGNAGAGLTEAGGDGDHLIEVQVADGTIIAASFAGSAITAAALATGVISADKIAGDAITEAKIADDAIAAEHLATGAITADAFAADALTAGTIATGAITADAFAADALVAATLATGAITADAFAADALTAGTFATDSIAADALASDAVTEIQSGLATSADTAQGSALTTVSGNVDSILTDTAEIGVAGSSLTAIPGLPYGVEKNAIFSNFEFLMVDATDKVTPETGLTVAGYRSIDGAAFGSATGVIAEVGNGIYQFDAAAADTNGDFITWRFSATGAADTFVAFKTET